MWTRDRTGRMRTRTGAGRFRASTIEDLGVPSAAIDRTGGKHCLACGKRFAPILAEVVYCGCDGRRRADDPIRLLNSEDRAMPETLIRIPADAARIVLHHPDFRRLGCAGRLRGDWVERQSDRKMFFEVHEPRPEDAREFMDFANRVAGHLIPATSR